MVKKFIKLLKYLMMINFVSQVINNITKLLIITFKTRINNNGSKQKKIKNRQKYIKINLKIIKTKTC